MSIVRWQKDHEPLGLLCLFGTAHRGLRTWAGTIACSSSTQMNMNEQKRERREIDEEEKGQRKIKNYSLKR